MPGRPRPFGLLSLASGEGKSFQALSPGGWWEEDWHQQGGRGGEGRGARPSIRSAAERPGRGHPRVRQGGPLLRHGDHLAGAVLAGGAGGLRGGAALGRPLRVHQQLLGQVYVASLGRPLLLAQQPWQGASMATVQPLLERDRGWEAGQPPWPDPSNKAKGGGFLTPPLPQGALIQLQTD